MTLSAAILRTHREHPEWYRDQIATAVGCSTALVHLVAKDCALAIPRPPRRGHITTISNGRRTPAIATTRTATSFRTSKDTGRLAVTFPDDLFASVKAEAIRKDLSIAALIRVAVAEHLSRRVAKVPA